MFYNAQIVNLYKMLVHNCPEYYNSNIKTKHYHKVHS